ncbi:MAG: type I polyketide synthase, partial [Ktedonobacteraceae bacterium]|nr:type I polyketide synthase [Ktedonobacteraceae bacterium]
MTDLSGDLDRQAVLKRALLEIRELRAQLKAVEQERTEAIAIIGMACRFPGGATDPEAFWQLLQNEQDAITEVPLERWDISKYYDPDPMAPGKMNTQWGGFLSGIDLFDADFFGVSPREAHWIDPQQRFLLEITWEALENASLTRAELARKQVGVFMGVCNNDYAMLNFSDVEALSGYAGAGSSISIIANRLSYLLDLHGPSMSIDTACSSSLVSLHLACQSLRNQECQMAIAGGVNLLISPNMTILTTKWGMMSPEGRCKTFDSQADGYVRGEGCGVVILKRLSQAQADGDQILAVVRGSAVNQDGRSNGLTAPNMQAQQAVLREALRQAGVQPEEVAYIETHGTGTPLGDPIEVEAITAVYGGRTGSELPCALGAVKTNIGHLEGAAGIAGVIKAVLALQRGAIPANLHFQHLNPNITFEQTPFFIPTRLIPWPEAKSRLAGVSSFGFGGTNAHVLLEQAPVTTCALRATNEEQEGLVLLSARNPQATHALAHSTLSWLEQHPERSFYDLAYSLAIHREHYSSRLAVVASNRTELQEGLYALLEHPPTAPSAVEQEQGKLIWVFGGQGTQWAGMARQMLLRWPLVRQHLERCDQLISTLTGWSLLDVLTDDLLSPRLHDTAVA